MTRYTINWDMMGKLSPEQRELAVQELNKIERIHEQNPLLFFHPYPKQHEFLLRKDRFKWILGGNRSGKTLITIIDDIIQALDEKWVPEHLKQYKKWTPPFKWRIVGMDFDQIELVIIEEMKRWIPPSQLVGDSWQKAYNMQRRIVRFKNGSICQFRTYEQPPRTHGGAALHRVHLDEEPPEDIWRENNIRVTDYNGDILCSMTPVEGLCVSLDTRVVTARGVLTYDELKHGELILSYNVEKGSTEWTPVHDIYINESYSGTMVHGTGRFQPKFTPDHRWVTPNRGLIAYKNLAPLESVVLASPHENKNGILPGMNEH